jgi:methionyl aminopeptidase
MLTQGPGDCFEWDDDWTVATADGGLAAQFEHTVLITEDGVEILTLPE